MNNGAYAGLRRAPRAAKPDPDTTEDEMPEDDCSEGEKKETDMDKTHTQADVETAAAQAAAAATRAANERFGAVLASEHYVGREALGQKLLGNEKLSAEEIIDMLQAAEKKTSTEAADDGSTMLANMRDGADLDLGNDGGEVLDPKADNYGWSKAVAKAQRLSGLKAKG